MSESITELTDPAKVVAAAMQRAAARPDEARRILARSFKTLGHPYVIAEAFCGVTELEDADLAGRAWGLLRGYYRRQPEAHAAYVHAMRRLRRSREAAFAARLAIRLFPNDAMLAELHAVQPLPPRAAIEQPAGEAARALVNGFESIGSNCEFGLMQRALGASPLGLLRFAGSPLGTVMKLLETRFDGVGEPGQMALKVGRGDYMLRHVPTGWSMHTCIKPGPDDDLDTLLLKLCRHTKFLTGKMIAGLTKGVNHLVYQRPDLSEGEIARLHAAVLRYGPNRLLAVRVAGDDHEPGSIAWRGSSLAVGYIDQPGKVSGTTKWEISTGVWLNLCAQAARHWAG